MLEPVVSVARPPWENQGPGEERTRALNWGAEERGHGSFGRVVQEPNVEEASWRPYHKSEFEVLGKVDGMRRSIRHYWQPQMSKPEGTSEEKAGAQRL